MRNRLFDSLPISAWTPESLSSKLSPTGQAITSTASAVYPVANMAIFIPFYLQALTTFSKYFVMNGSVVNTGGQIDMGVYDAKLTRLNHVQQFQTNAPDTADVIDVANFDLSPGLFFLAISMDNITGELYSLIMGNVGYAEAAGVYKQASAFPLPATATLVAPTSGYIPVFGLLPRSLP